MNIDPMVRAVLLGGRRELPQPRPLASVLHHVNKDDPNAAYIAQADLPSPPAS